MKELHCRVERIDKYIIELDETVFTEENSNKSKNIETKRKTVHLNNGVILWNANPDCDHKLDPNCWSGIRCLKCNGWYCL